MLLSPKNYQIVERLDQQKATHIKSLNSRCITAIVDYKKEKNIRELGDRVNILRKNSKYLMFGAKFMTKLSDQNILWDYKFINLQDKKKPQKSVFCQGTPASLCKVEFSPKLVTLISENFWVFFFKKLWLHNLYKINKITTNWFTANSMLCGWLEYNSN